MTSTESSTATTGDQRAQSAALREIWNIVHTPTSATRHRTAEHHFHADFDAIRKIVRPFIEANL